MTAIQTAVKERPIIMGAESVRAILEGRKTQTRRVMKPQPHMDDGLLWWHWSKYEGSASQVCPGSPSETWREHCPHGQPGDRLWVREAFEFEADPARVIYTDGHMRRVHQPPLRQFIRPGTRSPLFMPRWASRLTLEITKVRVERLQEIDEAGAIAEGVGVVGELLTRRERADECVDQYQWAWDKLNAKRGFGWVENPFVWVISFRRVGR